MVFSVAEVAEASADVTQAGNGRGLRADAVPVAQDLRQRVLALPVAYQSQHVPQDVVRQQAQQRTAALPAKRAERPQADIAYWVESACTIEAILWQEHAGITDALMACPTLANVSDYLTTHASQASSNGQS